MNDEELVDYLRSLGDHAGYEPSMHHTAADAIESLRERAEKANRIERETIKRCAAVAKVAWLTHAYHEIADADIMQSLCEHVATEIYKMGSGKTATNVSV